MAFHFNDFSNPKTAPTLIFRWEAAKTMFDKSKTDANLKAKILKHMNECDYKAWETIDIPKIINNYSKVTMRAKLSFLVLWYLANEKENQQKGCLCPGSSFNAESDVFVWLQDGEKIN